MGWEHDPFKPTSSTFILYTDLLGEDLDKANLKGETFHSRSAEVAWKFKSDVVTLDWTNRPLIVPMKILQIWWLVRISGNWN